ncbi:hypothetical protein [Streptomyces sp. NPDC056817]|uniref:hypothetical protein n=1 Tax=Streptomyces sp. NPDC056817 TaxID=3345950 RepID=UPI00368D0735
MNVRSSWVAETGQTREDTRLTQVGATTPVNPIQARSGVLPGSYDGRSRLSGLLLEGTAAMTATIHEGRAVIQGETSQGVYPVTLSSPEVITFAAGEAYPRVDLVVLKIYDNLYDSSNRNEAKIEIIQGEPGQPSQVPDVPPRCLPLWKVTVAAGASAGNGGINWSNSVEDLRNPVVAIGGILPVYNNAGVPGAYPGQYQDNDSAHYLQRWDGTAWVAYPKEIGGIAPNGMLSTGSYTGQYRDNSGILQRWNGTAWVNYQPPVDVETLSTGLTMATGWTLVGFAARRTHRIVAMTITVNRSGADITANSAGNITDEVLCTLPTGWRPLVDTEAPASDGYGSGGAVLTTNGNVSLRTWSATGVLTNGRNVRLTATYIQ